MRRARTGHLSRLDGVSSSWTRFSVSLRAQELQFFAADAPSAPGGGGGAEGAPPPPPPPPAAVLDLAGAVVSSPEALRGGRRHCISLEVHGGAPLHLSADGKEEQEAWLSALAAAAVSDAWPGGAGLSAAPQPLLYSMWVVQHAGTAAVLGGGGAEARVPSPFPRLPALKGVPAWQRKGLLLQKLRQCGIVFDGLPADAFMVDREVKRNTLLEVLDYFEGGGKAACGDARVLEDTFTMVRLNLFRTLPVAPEPVGDPDEEEVQFADAQWPHLNIVYELLRRLVASEHLELPLKKRLLDASFVKCLLQLFDNDEPREREFLKQVTHAIYSKLNTRRALIRRAVCNVFFETVLAGEAHRGVSELLEVLASVINGFAVPIKQEHKTMLTRVLLPLHKSRALAAYHVPLTYCMQLFASKEHALTRDIIPALLRFWPFATAQKQVMFLNELEDVLEYVQVRAVGGEGRRPFPSLCNQPRTPPPPPSTHTRTAGGRPPLLSRRAGGAPRGVHWRAALSIGGARPGAVELGALLPPHH
jgi:hypothetical protein